MASSTPTMSAHPEIDWSKWQPPKEGDVRSPCPMLNSLANHNILPHNGKNITKEAAIQALTTSINLSPSIAKIFSSVALTTNPATHANSFDLNHVSKHGVIEHDVSLSRGDVAFGDNVTFDAEVWKGVLDGYGGEKETSFETASKVRYERVRACRKMHEEGDKDFMYGIKEALFSYGETALLMGLLGDPETGKIPIEYLRILFEEERLPYKEGWRPSERPITQTDMNHLIKNLIQENEHKAEEASEIGFGTVHAVQLAITSFLPNYCTVM